MHHDDDIRRLSVLSVFKYGTEGGGDGDSHFWRCRDDRERCEGDHLSSAIAVIAIGQAAEAVAILRMRISMPGAIMTMRSDALSTDWPKDQSE